jgi:phosphocarrier protein
MSDVDERTGTAPAGNGPGRLSREFTILNQRGLHARASAKFVQLAGTFGAALTVERDGIGVGGTSIMGLMMLAAGPGTTIRVSAEGPDAAEALDAVGRLIGCRFGEDC